MIALTQTTNRRRDRFGRECKLAPARITVCCCQKGASDSIEHAEFPCYDCPAHPDSLMRQPGYGCRRHGYKTR